MDDSDRAKLTLAADLAKVHNRINQGVNQRFLLTGTNVTALGLFLGFLLKDFNLGPASAYEIKRYYLILAGYSLVNLLLYIQSRSIRKAVRTFAAWLLRKGFSTWELDWEAYRKALPAKAKVDQDAHNTIFRVTCFASPALMVLVSWHFRNVPYTQDVKFVFGLTAAFVLTSALYVILTSHPSEDQMNQEAQTDWEKVLPKSPALVSPKGGSPEDGECQPAQ